VNNTWGFDNMFLRNAAFYQNIERVSNYTCPVSMVLFCGAWVFEPPTQAAEVANTMADAMYMR
jgi:hypothetical protein